MRRLLVGALALALAAGRAGAHALAPDEVVARIATPSARVAMGVERASVDAKNPRVLLIRVGPDWFHLPPEVRAAAAASWRSSWRSAVSQGVVAVLDAAGEPVVRFGPAGRVTGVKAGAEAVR